MANNFTNDAPFGNHARSSTNGARYDSPGHRPGFAAEFHQALKGRHNRCFALSGLNLFLVKEPRALPWAELFRPFRAAVRNAPFCESAKLEKAIKENLRELGYGE
jgi:hypothetical protein